MSVGPLIQILALTPSHLIKVSLDPLDIRRNRPQIVPRLSIADISRTDDLLDLAWDEQLSEFERKSCCSQWEMKVSYDEHEHSSEVMMMKMKMSILRRATNTSKAWPGLSELHPVSAARPSSLRLPRVASS